ncbi:MAG: D-alanine--D-alanine ligase [Myxococcota bacterium]|nr:D-alanine--D-alanine ligase [Myxococcota bacterium]
MKKSRVGVLMGGWSAEREVSLRTGEGVATALESRGHDVARIVWGGDQRPLDELLRTAEVDVVFNALHGRGGEDGCVQGLLEIMAIPYTGSGVLASALAMDKLKAKEMFRLHNVPTPPYYVATRSDLGALEEAHASFGFPTVVKPRREGSSVGLSHARDLEELSAAIERALAYDDHALVERYVRGAEVHVGILEGRVLGAVEVVPMGGGLYDYQAKYTAGLSEYICPPRLPAARLRGVMNLGMCAARALACTSACRVDVLVTEGENEYVLEVNTLPGMTTTSLLPKIAAAAGIDYASLCEAILEGARLHAGLAATIDVPRSARRPPQSSHIIYDGACEALDGADDADESAPKERRVG